jgi:hypothetical protein
MKKIYKNATISRRNQLLDDPRVTRLQQTWVTDEYISILMHRCDNKINECEGIEIIYGEYDYMKNNYIDLEILND